MKTTLITLLYACPLLLVSGVAWCTCQNTEPHDTPPVTSLMQQEKSTTTGYPVVSPETVYRVLFPHDNPRVTENPTPSFKEMKYEDAY